MRVRATPAQQPAGGKERKKLGKPLAKNSETIQMKVGYYESSTQLRNHYFWEGERKLTIFFFRPLRVSAHFKTRTFHTRRGRRRHERQKSGSGGMTGEWGVGGRSGRWGEFLRA